jgi:hypothetical protein
VARSVLAGSDSVRVLGWLLAAYAVVGALFIVTALLVGGPLVSRLDRLATSATDTLDAATAAADAAADAFDGFDTSLTDARASASQAADLSRDTSVTLDGLAEAMSVSIFGSRPLEPLAGQFSASAEQLRQMGDDLDGIGTALTTNREDVARVGLEMRALADEMATLRGGLVEEQASGGLPLSWLFYGFLLWQLLPVTAAAIGGTWLLRHTRVVLVAGRADVIAG